MAWVHSGSLGLGHQVCDDLAIHPRDRQLVATRPGSENGRAYLGAMAAANYAFNNRQMLSQRLRDIARWVLSLGPAALGLVYDVAHNVAKLEVHQVTGRRRELWVHRYRAVGQPVLVPGDMGRASYVLRGTALAEEQTFASSAHGAGRAMSRSQAKKLGQGRRLEQEMLARQVLVRAKSRATLAEEMPEAYKNVAQVVSVMHGAGLATLVARTRPLAVIKG